METSDKHKTQLHVAVGVVFNTNGEVLIAQRPKHAIGAGFWEFPGGKVEAAEQVETALRRELQEELNIQVEFISRLIKFRYEYPDRSVLLDVWEVIKYHGKPLGLEGQVLQWVEPEKLLDYKLLAANRPIVTSIQLPPYYLITSEPKNKEKFLRDLENALNKGVTLIQLRARELSSSDYQAIADACLALCRLYGAKLLLNHSESLSLVDKINADGVHLTSHQLMQLNQRPVESNHWVSASCHNLSEIKKAEELNLDFLVLGSVLPTASHPNTAVLGWDGFENLVEHCNLPIYALGGMTFSDIELAKKRGGQGIAGIRFIEPEPA